MTSTTQTAMAEMLDAMGFEAMARDVRVETETDRLRKYAAVIVKNLERDRKPKMARKAANLFRLHRPALY